MTATIEWGLLEKRVLSGYLFKIYDADWGFTVEIWKDDVLLGAEFATCYEANCKLTDDELLALLP